MFSASFGDFTLKNFITYIFHKEKLRFCASFGDFTLKDFVAYVFHKITKV